MSTSTTVRTADAVTTPGVRTSAVRTADALPTADAVTTPYADPVPTAPRMAQPFHRAARAIPRPHYWWRPLVALAVFAVSYVLMVLALVIGVFLLTLAQPSLALSESMGDPRNPMDMVVGLGVIALMMPAVLLATRVAYGRVGMANSVRGRFRWALLGRAAMVIVPLYLLLNVGGTVLMGTTPLEMPALTAPVIAAAVIIVLVVPLQAAGEEYAFRALPLQVFGTWLRSPVWGILIPVPLFMVSHGYDWVGQIDIALFAITMGLLAWKTGGLELPILLHVANNWTLFLLAPFMSEPLAQGAVPPIALLFSTVPMLLMTAGLWWWYSRREGLRIWEPTRGTLHRHGSRSAGVAPAPAADQHRSPEHRESAVVPVG